MATVFIQKRKGKDTISYAVRYKDPNTRENKYYHSYRKMKDAQQAANDLRGLIDAGSPAKIRERKIRLSLLTFGQVSDLLRTEWVKRLKLGELAKKTHDEYIIRANVLGRVFGHRLLCEITGKEIEGYRETIASELTAVTANRSLAVIKKVFRHGLKVKAVLEDPSADIKFLSEKDHMRNRFLLPHDLDRLIEACQATRGKFYMPALILLGAEHGASRQEVLSLKWADINFTFKDRGLIRFFRSKTRRERMDYLMPRTKEALLAWQEHQAWMRHRHRIEGTVSELVFSHMQGAPLSRFDRAWQVACQAAGIKDFHFHDLRHTFCSNLLLSGADLKDVKEMIGHADIGMTDRYAHLTLDRMLLRQKSLASHYSNDGPRKD